jgi:8-oxo-dGTP diphosphatase
VANAAKSSPFTPLDTETWYAGLSKLALSANAVLRDGEGRIALVRNTYRDGWSLPGGVVDDNEAPAAACARELAEELGYEDAHIGELLAVQWAARVQGSPVQFISLTFDAGVCPDPAALRAQPEEIAEIRFFPPTELPEEMRPFIARRLQQIFAAGGGGAVYLEEPLISAPPVPPAG